MDTPIGEVKISLDREKISYLRGHYSSISKISARRLVLPEMVTYDDDEEQMGSFGPSRSPSRRRLAKRCRVFCA